MPDQAFIENEIRRADSYRLLAVCFYEPQRELFLQEDVFANLCRSLTGIAPEAALSAAHLQHLFASTTQQELLVEYARLFVGPNQLVAAPYGSCYLEKERVLMGESTLEALRIYRQYGLAMAEDFKNAPDHVTVELEFQYFLICKEIEALQNDHPEEAADYLGAHLSFSEKFLKKWIPPFTQAIIAGSSSAFYTELARCLDLFIREDAWLSGLPEALLPRSLSVSP
jgi:putative dimethyl sulfoxide reductase chaperone